MTENRWHRTQKVGFEAAAGLSFFLNGPKLRKSCERAVKTQYMPELLYLATVKGYYSKQHAAIAIAHEQD
ncbi:MAG: hypothetical protein L6Q97_04140 [Thermoanaerobaculia bacterium]|nr:hypothetical protein [Thermoanaerobaculia bacterium]